MIGAFLRGLRESRGLTQAAAAVRLGVSRPHLSLLESGRSAPSVDTLARVLDGYGATAEERAALGSNLSQSHVAA